MSDVTKADLDRWRQLAQAATPGPWEHVVDEGSHVVRQTATTSVPPYPVARLRRDNIGHCDAEFGAAARDAVPRLIAAVVSLTEHADTLSETLETVGEQRAEATRRMEARKLLHAASVGYKLGLREAAAIERDEVNDLRVDAWARLSAAEAALADAAELVGIGEAAAILGVTKQRVHQLRDQMPTPVAQLAMGPVWRAVDVREFAGGRRRVPGRPVAAVSGVPTQPKETP